MDVVFGLPAGVLSWGLTILLLAGVGAVSVLAARNVVFLKMGLRNIPRRRGRSALIVLGLMLGTTIIASALLTGETMATSVRSSVVQALGATDETVTAGTDAETAVDVGLLAARPYFPADPAVSTIDVAAASLPVDGVMAAIIEPVAAQHVASGRTEPRVTLFAPDARRAEQFGFAAVRDLGDGEVLLNEEAADELRAEVGSTISIVIGDQLVTLVVAGIDVDEGTSADGAAAVVPLTAAQELLGRPGEANHVLVSNTGDQVSGADATDDVEPALDEAVATLGLDAQPSKRDGLDAADASGDAFVQLFTTFGSFSMAAGILLIFLIFVMLSAERRPEMGMARAVGTQRRHLVQTFLYEGAVYDLAAAALGAVLGIAVSLVMVRAVAGAFTAEGLELSYSLSGRSLVIAYGLGVLLTLVVVTLSAWHVSRLNIVSAIRDLPEPEEASSSKVRWVAVATGLLLGTVLAVSGATGQVYLPWMLGVSIVIVSLVPVASRLGGRRRAYTAAGGALVVLWLLPLDTYDSLFGEMSMDFSVWVVGGLVVVIAATWLVTFNADLLLGLASRVAAPFASLRPITRMAVAYPLKSRFRTGVTMSMFMLVVFTLVTGSTIPAAFTESFNDVETYGGGYDVQASTAPAAAVADLRAELPADVAGDIGATGAQSLVPVEARQTGAGAEFERYPLRGVDGAFLEHTTYELAATARGYDTSQEVWEALATQPELAVVDAFVAPRRDQWGFAVLPEFQLSGFFVEDGSFEPVPVITRDPLTGTTIELTVIGVLSDSAPYGMAGITVAQSTLAPFGDRARPTVHHFAVRDGADPEAVAGAVEASLLARGVEADSYQRLLDDAVGASTVFIRLIQGFMALGLVVGIAALGVISARAAVERRQQIGMLRAIGFQPKMIRRTLLAETSTVTVTAITVGTILGLVLSYNIIVDTRDQPGYTDLRFAVPWAHLAVIFGAVVIAALLTTLVATHRATQLYPAEALRYR